MPTYLPAPRPDELLYSLLARAGRHLGLEAPGAVAEFFLGDRHAPAVVDLPCRLSALQANLPAHAVMDPEDVAWSMTLYPYYAAFQGGPTRRRMLATMSAEAGSLHLWSGLAAFRVPRVTRLRFCPLCDRAALADHGELWWRRVHQLPGVLVCPEHACLLRESLVAPGLGPRNAYVPASARSCPNDAPPLCVALSDAAADRLLGLARASAALLEDRTPPLRPVACVASYRGALAEAGLMRSACKVHLPGLEAAVADFWGEALPLLPGLTGSKGRPGPWLAAIVRRHRKSFHPLHHLVLTGSLEAAPSRVGPFGTGPWRCINPLAAHRGRSVVRRLEVRADHGALTGTFCCGCGYVFTRRWRAGALGPERFKAFGPLLEPALRALFVPGASRRSVAKALGLDAKTMLREAAALGIDAPWALPAAPPRHDASPLREPVVGSGGARTGTPRRDWPAIDVAAVQTIRAARDAILSAAAPSRVTMVAIERRLGAVGSLRRRRRLLPLAIREAETALEDVEAFRRRRVAIVARRLFDADPGVRPWQVMRAAGVTDLHRHLVDVALDDCRRSGRGAHTHPPG